MGLLAIFCAPPLVCAHSPRGPHRRLPLSRSDSHFYISTNYSPIVYSFEIKTGLITPSTAPFVVRALAYSNQKLYALGDGQLAVDESGGWKKIETAGAISTIASDGSSLWVINDHDLLEFRDGKSVSAVHIRGIKNPIFSLFATPDGLFVSCVHPPGNIYHDAVGGGLFSLDPKSGIAVQLPLPKEVGKETAYSFLPTGQKGIYRVPFWGVWGLKGAWTFDTTQRTFRAGGSRYFLFDEITAGSKQPLQDEAAFYQLARKLKNPGFYEVQHSGVYPGDADEFWELAYRHDWDYFKHSFVNALGDPWPPMISVAQHHDDDKLWRLAVEGSSHRPLKAYLITSIIARHPGEESEKAVESIFRDNSVDQSIRTSALSALEKLSISRARSLCKEISADPKSTEWEKSSVKSDCGG